MSILPAPPFRTPRPIWVDGIRWTLVPAAVGAIDPNELMLAELREQGRVEQIKHGPHRTVWRVQLQSGPVFWKHCRIYSPRAFLRECIRPPKAKLEFDKARTLAERGIDTVTPLAWGTRSRWRPGESFLITQALEDAVPLTHYLERELPCLPSAIRAAKRRELARCLGAFLARLHRAGVVHPDLHPGNILIRWPDESEPRFYLIDLHAIRIGSELGYAASRDNLVMLNRWFLMRAERTDRLRCWNEYSRRRGYDFAAARAWEEATWDSNRRFWEARDRRCMTNNRYFRKVRSAIACGHAVNDIDPLFLRQMLTDPDAPFLEPSATMLKDGHSATVVEITVPTQLGPRAMVLKRFRVTKWHDTLANAFRRSPALRSWRLGHGLRERGLPTPRPWLVLHRRYHGLRAEGYLLCEKVHRAVGLREWLNTAGAGEVRAMIDRLARLLRGFHQRGLSHRDLKAANVLVSDNELSLIDLDGVRVHRHVPRGMCLRDLTRLHVSFRDSPRVTRAHKLRFLRIYLNWAVSGKKGWKDWWKQIDARTRAKIERNARRGRPLA